MHESKNRDKESFFRRRAPILFLAAFAFVLFWQYFLLDQTFYAGDMAFALLPLGKYAFGRLASGELPLWNPYLLAGTPGLAEPTHQTFYLPNVLMLLTGVPRGLGWLMPLHLFWMALGVYLFARSALRLSRLAALFAALCCSFGGLTLGGLSIVVYVYAAAWLPWVLLSYEKARSGGWMAWAGVCIALQLIPGGVVYAYYTLVLLLAYHLFRCFEPLLAATAANALTKVAARRGWLTLGLTLLVAVGLSAAQLVPQTELALLSERGTHAAYEYVVFGSLKPLHLPVTLLFPKFYGLFDSPTREGFLPNAELAYIGIPAFICAVIAAFASRRRHAVWFWLALALISASLAIGQYNPLYHTLYNWVPGFASFRWPTRWLILTIFSGSMLAGLGIEALQQAPFHRRVRFTAVAIGSGIGVAGALFLLLSGAPDEATASAWPQIGLVALTVALLAMLPAAQPDKKPDASTRSDATAPEPEPDEVGRENDAAPSASRVVSVQRVRRVVMGLIGLLALDLWWMSQSMELQHTLSVAALESKPATVAYLESRSPQERFWTAAPPIPLNAWQVGDAAGDTLEFRARSAAMQREMMTACMASEFGTLGLTGAWGSLMPTRRNARPLYQPVTDKLVQQRWLRLLNARYYLDLQPMPDADLQIVNQPPPYIYRDEKALPRAFWVPQARRLPPEKIADVISTGRIGNENFDPRGSVLLESPATQSSEITSSETAAPSGATTSVEIVESRPESVRLRVLAPRDGYVVLMDNPYPGWRATVDKTPTDWEPANWVGRALPVTRGTHEIVFTFDPQSVRLGLFISLLTLAGLVAGFAARGFSLPRKNSSHSTSNAR